ncbi:MAG: hypothetical protein M1835_006870 [Candelina submexicana]|nr:MAG: hypothetical protein M1835_006870 [Candelina submexicana]
MEKITEKRVASPDDEREIVAPQVTSKKLRSLSKHGIDADEAMKAFAGQEGEVNQIDDATNRRLLRRIDMNLLPLLCVVYGLNYLDSEVFPRSKMLDQLG